MNSNGLYTDDFLDEMRLTADPFVDQFVAQVFSDEKAKLSLQQWMSKKSTAKMLAELQSTFPQFTFIAEASKLPEWSDPKRMAKGAAFFAIHSQQIMTLLGLLSLPYCYAAANGAMVLYLSELMRNQTGKRLYDTAIFVWEMMNPDAFSRNGKGYVEILKIRIRHAAGRYYVLKTGKWEGSWGVPINQEDMAGTNLSFSLLVIRGLRKLGINVTYTEQTAFIHLWSVVGQMLGMIPDMIPKDIKMAQQLELAIRRRQFKPSVQGVALTSSLTEHIVAAQSSKASAGDILGLMRHLLGTEVSDLLSIKAAQIPSYKLNLMEVANAVGDILPQADTLQQYNRAYLNFKRQNPAG
ncbi:MAG: oxygenase MpaB family protein [Pedobacter sp.]